MSHLTFNSQSQSGKQTRLKKLAFDDAKQSYCYGQGYGSVGPGQNYNIIIINQILRLTQDVRKVGLVDESTPFGFPVYHKSASNFNYFLTWISSLRTNKMVLEGQDGYQTVGLVLLINLISLYMITR